MARQGDGHTGNACSTRTGPPPVGRTALEAHLRRLAKTYSDRVISDAEYERDRDRLWAQLASAQQAAPSPDLANAATVLAHLGSLIDAATDEERRAVVRCAFAKFWVEKETSIKAITPTQIYLPLIGAMYQAGVLLGWLTGLEPATP